jgi:alpha-glucosidase (family GH31 glycosyl hydrolase)
MSSVSPTSIPQAVREITSIPLQSGEGWWGGLAADGALMPLGTTPHRRDLALDHHNNQAAPFLVSNRGRSIWSEGPFAYQFGDGTLTVEHTQPLVVNEDQNTLRAAYLAAAHAHFPASGHLPHELLLGRPQYNTWIELLYAPTQAKVLEYAHGILNHGFPSGVLMIDDNWMEDYGRWSFRPAQFPDPKSMIAELRDLGFPVMLWVCPFVSADGVHFLDLERRGLLLNGADGETAVRRWWNGHSAVLDLSNPAAAAWLTAQLDELVETFGVGGFKFDAGDPGFYRPDDRYHTPSSPTDQCRRWAQIGLRFPLNEFRASWKMGGQALAQRQRDKAHAWANEQPAAGGATGLNSLIPDGIAQGLLGYPFSCPDMIGGGDYGALDFSSPDRFDPELFVRSAQVAALMPMMQFSAAPWRLLDEVHLAACRDAAWLHVHFGELILDIAQRTAVTGEPIMCSLEYAFPGQGFASVLDQFMLGNDVLAAPCTHPAQRRQVLFPEGRWLADDGSVVMGPASVSIEVPVQRLPYFRRDNSESVS